MTPYLAAACCLLAARAVAAETKACAHRGDRKNAPENTIPAFLSALDKGAHQIEFDLHLTQDGRLVVIHDDTVDRTTDGSGRVADLTFAEIRALNAGAWFAPEFAGVRIPTFREALEAIPRHVLCNVHLKNAPGVAEAAAHTLVEKDRLDHCFLAATKEQITEARKHALDFRLCNMTRQSSEALPYAETTIEMGTEFIQLVGEMDGAGDIVKLLHEHGVTVNYFEAHTEEKIRACVEAGVDYVLTDDLDVCLRVLATYGVKPLGAPEENDGEGKPVP